MISDPDSAVPWDTLFDEDEEERLAIEYESFLASLTHRGFPEIYRLEDLATEALERPERFVSEHWCARMILEKDIPKWRDLARAVASGLGVQS